MDKKKQPGIIFKNVFLKDLNFTRKPNISTSEISIKFSFNYSVSEDKKNMNCELVCDITDTADAFFLHCSMLGVFLTIEGQENLELDEFAKNTASALMLPYMRELVMTTTVRAGLPPINFPPVNIRAMLKDENAEIAAKIE